MNRRTSIFILCAIGLSLFVTACPSPVPHITLTVTFDSQGADTPADPPSMQASGTDPESITLETLPDEPVRSGYDFNGWHTAPNGGGSPFTVDTVITESLTVYADWAEVFTVTFNGQEAYAEASPASMEVSEATSSDLTLGSLPINPTKVGCVFEGWFTGPNGGGSPFTAETAITDSLTVYALWDSSDYELRETGPSGGLIFYINENAESDGWKYLECAPTEAVIGSDYGYSQLWGSDSVYVPEATGKAIGTGYGNTKAIVAAMTEAEYTGSYAAKKCDTLTYNGFSDWFLPSTGEYAVLYSELTVNNLGPGVSSENWTSTQHLYNASLAYTCDLHDGDVSGTTIKYLARMVWPIRRF